MNKDRKPILHNTEASSGKLVELDGIRAMSILFVLLVHISYGRLPGGFLGVDIFFVLSGYLITLLMLREIAGHGTVNLPKFYARRALRILPPLLMATLLGIALAPHGEQWQSNAYRRIAAVLLFYGNFETPQTMGNLAHTWSLAIEEQFYLVWPALLIIAIRLGRLAPAMLACIIIFGCLAIRYYMVATMQDQAMIYSFTFARIDSIMLGCLLAMLERRSFGTPVNSGRQVGWLALAWATGVALTVCLFLGTREFAQSTPLAFISLAVVAGLFIVASQRISATSLLRRTLGLPVAQWLGQRSYGLYLYHYPIFGAFEALRIPGDFFNFVLVAVLKVCTALAVTELAWRLVERPILGFKTQFAMPTLAADSGASSRGR